MVEKVEDFGLIQSRDEKTPTSNGMVVVVGEDIQVHMSHIYM